MMMIIINVMRFNNGFSLYVQSEIFSNAGQNREILKGVS